MSASTPRLTEQWRRHIRGHAVLIGFGAAGRAAADAMLAYGRRPADIAVIDTDQAAVERAASHGLFTVHGCATHGRTLREACVHRASAVIVTVGSDETTVSAVLAVRAITASVKVLVAIRDWEYAELVRQCAADVVVVCGQTTGRLLGKAMTSPEIVRLTNDLLTPETGYVVAERAVAPDEVGLSPQQLTDIVLGVVRDGRLTRAHVPTVKSLRDGDCLLYVRQRN